MVAAYGHISRLHKPVSFECASATVYEVSTQKVHPASQQVCVVCCLPCQPYWIQLCMNTGIAPWLAFTPMALLHCIPCLMNAVPDACLPSTNA
jgi:hypothetical protein